MSKTELKMHFNRKHKSFKTAESTQDVPDPHNSAEPAQIIEIRGTGSDFDLQDDTPANLTRNNKHSHFYNNKQINYHIL
jgi:hypothetical protein